MAKAKAATRAGQAPAEATSENKDRPSMNDRQTGPTAQTKNAAGRGTAARGMRPSPPANADNVSAGNVTADGPGAAASVEPGGDIGLEEREEMIRTAAYERYMQRGGQGGSAIDDWLEAEAAIDNPGRQTDQQREKP